MLTLQSWIHIAPAGACLEGHSVPVTDANEGLLKRLYHQYVGDYPKFFKMDPLCRLGFIASELLLQNTPDRFSPREDRAVILFSHSGSFASDSHYQQTIADPNDYFPSPSVFVYTLANIVTGEIAIRNHYFGETSCYLLNRKDPAEMIAIVEEAFLDSQTRSVLCGWVEYVDETHYETTLFLVGPEDHTGKPIWNQDTINDLINF